MFGQPRAGRFGVHRRLTPPIIVRSSVRRTRPPDLLTAPPPLRTGVQLRGTAGPAIEERDRRGDARDAGRADQCGDLVRRDRERRIDSQREL
jgi:hypothetical protein